MTAALYILTGFASGLLVAHRAAVLDALMAAVDWLTTDSQRPPPIVARSNVRMLRDERGGDAA